MRDNLVSNLASYFTFLLFVIPSLVYRGEYEKMLVHARFQPEKVLRQAHTLAQDSLFDPSIQHGKSSTLTKVTSR